MHFNLKNQDWTHPVFLEHATKTQKSYVDAMIKHKNNQCHAADSLGISRCTLQSGLRQLVKKTRLQGLVPEFDMYRPAPVGMKVKGVSQFEKIELPDGRKINQWTKFHENAEEREAQTRAYLEGLMKAAEGLAPRKPRKPKPTKQIAVIPLGDAHVGLLTWAKEVGVDFDLDKACAVTEAAIDESVSRMPDVEEVILINLGDFFHANGNKNVTPQSGNFLDVANRWAEVYERGIQLTIYMIEAYRKKGVKVRYRANPGNHDPEATLALSVAISAFYSKADDVIIETAITPAWYYRYGKTLIGTCHGDGAKMPDLPALMAWDMKKDWGETDYHYWYVGHFHHRQAKEHVGCEVESFNTLAPTDAWHNFKGYRAKRSLTMIIIDYEFGEVSRYLIDARALAKDI